MDFQKVAADPILSPAHTIRPRVCLSLCRCSSTAPSCVSRVIPSVSSGSCTRRTPSRSLTSCTRPRPTSRCEACEGERDGQGGKACEVGPSERDRGRHTIFYGVLDGRKPTSCGGAAASPTAAVGGPAASHTGIRAYHLMSHSHVSLTHTDHTTQPSGGCHCWLAGCLNCHPVCSRFVHMTLCLLHSF